MTCKSCGKELPDNTKFCTECGKDPAVEAAPVTATAQPPESVPQTKPAKKPLNKKVLIGIAGGVVLLLIIIIVAASGGGKGGLKGEWVPASGSGSYESLDFSGSNVTLDTGIGGAMTGTYTYKDNTLTVTVQGFPMEIPLEIAKSGKYDVLLIGGVTYAHPKDVDKVKDADAAPVVADADDKGKKSATKGKNFDGEYKAAFGSYTLTMTVADNAFNISGMVSASGVIAEDGSFNASIAYQSYHFTHEQESFVSKNSDGNLNFEFVLVGGKSIAAHEIEALTKDMPAITHKHKYDANPLLKSKGNGSVEIVGGAFNFDVPGYKTRTTEDSVFNTAVRLFWSGTAFGSKTFFFIDKNNDLWAWGENNVGQLGDGTGVDKEKPVKILSDVIDVQVIDDVAHQICAFKSDDTVWRWGMVGNEKKYAPEQVASNAAERIADNIYLKTNGDLEIDEQVVLTHVKEVTPNNTILILSDGAAYIFPHLYEVNSTEQFAYTKIYDNSKSVNTIDGGFIVLTNNGELYGKGTNAKGELGNGTKIPKEDWMKIADNVSYYDPGDNSYKPTYKYSKIDGSVWEWNSDAPTPKQVEPPKTTPATTPAEGTATAAAGSTDFPTLPNPS